MKGLLAVVALCVAACGDDELRPVAFQDYGAAAVAALCEFGVRCRYEPDLDTCLRFVDEKAYDLHHAAFAIAAGRIAFDPDAAAQCLAQGRSAFCGAPAFETPACGRVFVGLQPKGAPCVSASECAQGATCGSVVCQDACCAGSCGPPLAGVPMPALAAIGDPCITHSDCVATGYCADDHTCHLDPDTAGQACLYGCTYGDLYCDTFDLVCTEFAAIGASCENRRCNPNYAWCDGATCQPRPAAGQACDVTKASDQLCTPDTNCDATGVCAARGGPGSACASDGDCTEACDLDTSRCVPYPVCPAARTR